MHSLSGKYYTRTQTHTHIYPQCILRSDLFQVTDMGMCSETLPRTEQERNNAKEVRETQGAVFLLPTYNKSNK